MQIRIKRRNTFEKMMLILGILASTDVVYLFVVGQTPILAVYVYAFLCIIVCMLGSRQGNRRFTRAVRSVPWELWAFLAAAVGSIVCAAHYFPGDIGRCINGLIYLVLLAFVVIFILMYEEYKDSLLQGLFIGIVLNALLSLVALALYQRGVEFSLRDYFPRMTSITRLSNMNTGRFYAWGWFREPGYLMRWYAIVALLVWEQIKNRKAARVIFFLCTLFIAAYTRSAATSIFAVAVVGYLFVTKAIKLNLRNVLLSAAVLFLVVVYVATGSKSGDGLIGMLYEAAMDIFSKSGNAERRTGMTYGMVILRKYLPFGCGWNMFAAAFSAEGYYKANIIGKTWGNVLGSYSGAIDLVADLGVFSVFLLWFFLSRGVRLLLRGDTYEKALGMSVLAFFALLCSTNMFIEPVIGVLVALMLSTVRRGGRTAAADGDARIAPEAHTE